jgi:hypothetical protein
MSTWLIKNMFSVPLTACCVYSKHTDIKIRSEAGEKVVYSRFIALNRQGDYVKVEFHLIRLQCSEVSTSYSIIKLQELRPTFFLCLPTFCGAKYLLASTSL